MAFKKPHTIIITLDNNMLKTQYAGILSNEDLATLDDAIKQSFVIPNAYHRVGQMQVTKERIDFTLAIYNADVSKLIAIKQYSFIPDTSESAINYHTQCYEYAKSLDEYADSVDC